MGGEETKPLPKSLLASYEEAFNKGHYNGTAAEWARLRYMLFRLDWEGDREPPGYTRWIQNQLDYERQQSEE